VSRVVPIAAFALCVGCLDQGDDPWLTEPAREPAPVAQGPVGDAAPADVPADEISPCPRAEGPVEVQVTMLANAFVPANLEICAGDTVTWTNQDTKEHTVTSGTPEVPDGRFDSGPFYFGRAWSWTFEDEGDWLYFCRTHKKKMRDARVVVR
jgi:plastocyanin